jgi:hypothetical protein
MPFRETIPNARFISISQSEVVDSPGLLLDAFTCSSAQHRRRHANEGGGEAHEQNGKLFSAAVAKKRHRPRSFAPSVDRYRSEACRRAGITESYQAAAGRGDRRCSATQCTQSEAPAKLSKATAKMDWRDAPLGNA